jgi:hypothetical protein
MSELTVLLTDGSTRPWSLVRQAAKDVNLTFEVLGSNTGITFYLGPDIFPDSYRLAWMTPEEKNGGPFLDHRVRSSDPDDFLSRIEHLASGSEEPFVPKF